MQSPEQEQEQVWAVPCVEQVPLGVEASLCTLRQQARGGQHEPTGACLCEPAGAGQEPKKALHFPQPVLCTMSCILAPSYGPCEELWAVLYNSQNIFWTQDAPGTHSLHQWLSTYLMLRPFITVPYVVVTPSDQIHGYFVTVVLLLLCIIMQTLMLSDGRDPHVENHHSRPANSAKCSNTDTFPLKPQTLLTTRNSSTRLLGLWSQATHSFGCFLFKRSILCSS